MKPEPVIAMVLLLLLGMWLVLQPTLSRGKYDLLVRSGAVEMLVLTHETDNVRTYEFTSPPRLRALGTLDAARYNEAVAQEIADWNRRPAFERTLLGFFNITSWGNLGWVAAGLIGQGAFFGRMMVQWIVSEKRRESQVPEIFWLLSLLGGVLLFAYFVWRVDFVGVLGQSTGIVIYARNLRLIHKQKRRIRAE